MVEHVSNEVTGNGKAIVMVSGGVDSTITAVLSKKALGKRAVFYFIDNGLQRRGERKRIKGLFKKIGIEVKIFDAANEFIRNVSDCTSGPEKRDLLADMLVDKALGISRTENSRHLIFGTIKNDLLVCDEYSDSITGFKLIEPLKNLTKDKVIAIAKELGLPDELCIKQHFAGVGFAIRIEGNITKKKLTLIRDLTEIVEKKVQEMGLHKNLWGYFPFLLSTKIDGKYVVLLRIVESELGLMAEIPEINKKQLIELRDGILNRKPEVGRIFFDLTPKPVSLIELM